MNLSAKILGLFLVGSLMFSACKQAERSDYTGWNYNDPEWGGFEKIRLSGTDNWT